MGGGVMPVIHRDSLDAAGRPLSHLVEALAVEHVFPD